MDPEFLRKISEDLAHLKKYSVGILLYGSHVTGKADERSDIDICIIAGPGQDPMNTLSKSWQTVRADIYDIRIFEHLPLHLQIRVLISGIWLYQEDPAMVGEYLYPVWKRWDDQRFYQDPIPGYPGIKQTSLQ